jgi:hypothetical protein
MQLQEPITYGTSLMLDAAEYTYFNEIVHRLFFSAFKKIFGKKIM